MSDWRFRILIDGECPLCVKEAAMLRWMDGGRGRLDLEDIADPAFDAGKYGKTWEEVMGRIHGVTPEGEVIEGVEVFRRSYEAVGWGWLLAWTRWAMVRPLVDRAYVWFAKNRHRLTFRQDPCASGRCALPVVKAPSEPVPARRETAST